MIRLNPNDASVLARIAQYLELPHETRKKMLEEVTTREAHQIGSILIEELDPNAAGVSADVRETAKALRFWSDKSREATAPRSEAFNKQIKRLVRR